MFSSDWLRHVSMVMPNFFVKLKTMGCGWLLCLGLVACQTVPIASETVAPAAPAPVVVTPTPSASGPAPTAAAVNPIFSPLLPALKQQTQVPLLLPAYIPEAESPDRVFASLESADASQYEISLAFSPDCRGGTACRLGSLSGAVATPKAAVVVGKAVPLSNGIMADFVDAKCGANCSDSTLTWDQAGYRYVVATKAGKEATLVKMANSAIANGSL